VPDPDDRSHPFGQRQDAPITDVTPWRLFRMRSDDERRRLKRRCGARASIAPLSFILRRMAVRNRNGPPAGRGPYLVTDPLDSLLGGPEEPQRGERDALAVRTRELVATGILRA